MPNKKLKKSLTMLLVTLFFSIVSTTVSARLYIYQLPNGSRIMTNHMLTNKHYKLVRSGGADSGLGILLASGNRQFFRTDTSAYDNLIRNSANEHRVDHALIKAIIHAESAFNPYARSIKGARGLMQLLPTTAAMYGVTNLYDPQQNIDAGVQHLKYLLKKYSNNSRLAVAAYNAGETAVRRYGGVPPYKETRTYVAKVFRYKTRYKIL